MGPEASPLHEVSTIETPEQIELDLPLGGVGSRALAYIIDLLWQTVPILAAGYLVVALLPLHARRSLLLEKHSSGQFRFTLLAMAFVSAILFFINFGYFALFELLWKGQSPGKRALGLRVIRDGGYPIDGSAALVRNLLRVVDFLPGLYFVGIAVLFAGRKGKRVGDYAAGTLVVKEQRSKPSVAATEPPQHASPLSPTERSLIVEFLARRPDLAGDARLRVGRALANQMATRLGQSPPAEPERFLEELCRHGFC